MADITNYERKSIKPLEHYNMSDFLKGQASKIFTKVSEEDTVGYVLKHGKPMVIMISNERYERLLKAGIDVNEF